MAFESLTDKLQNVFKKLKSKGRLTEEDVKVALKEVKMALLEADVNFKVVKQFTKSVQEKAGSAKEKINNGIAVFRFLREQELIPAVWTKLKTFLLHIRPRVLQGHLQFGLSDPANTGQVLGGIAMIPFLYQTELQIKPDFEADKNYIKGQLYTRGHICCIHLVVLLIRLLLDKKLRGVIHMIRENK